MSIEPIKIELSLPDNLYGKREAIREFIVKEFLKEKSGEGTGELSSKYSYVVEKNDNDYLFLARPAYLNKGMDFIVCFKNERFENKKGKKSNRPSHNNIIDDLITKKLENIKLYEKLLVEITKIYNCEKEREEDWLDLKFEKGFNLFVLLKSIKWLLIEQDVTYWNFSGRNKLYSEILKV